MRIAEVVIANNSLELDKIFHYIAPDELDISVGIRVIVPFGNGNKTLEGIVIGFASESKYKSLKRIKSVLDKAPLCTKQLIKLAIYMRDKYLCTYYQALKSIIPSGISVKTTKWITLIDENIDIEKVAGRSNVKKQILQRLINAGGTVDSGSLSDLSSAGVSIKALEESGIVSLDETIAQNVKSKQIRMADTKIPYDEITQQINLLHKKAPKQAKMLEILRQTGEISVADLVAFSGSTYSSANTLYKKGLINFYDKIVFRNAYNKSDYEQTTHLQPTEEQSEILKSLIYQADNNDIKPNLIRGVTGSGKTEVFLQIISHMLKKGKQAIVLVPEISLTPQMVSRFVGRFGDLVSVLHSGLSLGERYDEWLKIRSGKVSVAVGARSAIFAPFENLGIIIIDEEHETTYKSDMMPCYNTKEVALFRGKLENAMVIFGSATPAIESYYMAKMGQYNLFEMKSRHNLNKMPKVDIIDMREELEKGNKSVFSEKLKLEVEKNIKNGEQTILFLNRRGFNSFVMCRSCGEALLCKNCNITLTYHKNTGQLKCHYCGYERENLNICPSCNSTNIRFMGTGTEKIEEELINLFGENSFIRMDADTTSGKNSHEIILRRFEREKIPILLGTQMVTKGLDFPNVTLVGVLAADLTLNIDDYRAAERTFSQLTQVCGRAGRGDLTGRAVIQTYQPQHYAITLAKEHNYVDFFKNEISIRKKLSNPPFCDIILILMQGENEKSIKKELTEISNKLRGQNLFVLGPTPAPYSKIKNKYRWRVIIKHSNSDELLPLFHEILTDNIKSKNYINIDVNPNSLN